MSAQLSFKLGVPDASHKRHLYGDSEPLNKQEAAVASGGGLPIVTEHFKNRSTSLTGTIFHPQPLLTHRTIHEYLLFQRQLHTCVCTCTYASELHSAVLLL